MKASWKMSNVKIRLWTNTKLSKASSPAPSNAVYASAPARRATPYINQILPVPSTTLQPLQP
jgi:hypothetical protein